MKINEFVEQTTIDTPLLITQVKEGVTNAGSPYLSISFRDNTGSIEGKLWDVKDYQREKAKAGTIVQVKAEIIKYRNVLQLKIIGLNDPEEEVSMQDFVLCGPYREEQLRSMIHEAIESIGNTEIKQIVTAIYEKYDDKIYASAAAAKNHHEYQGGLATHICSMLKLANLVCDCYAYINRDLLIAGVLTHDIGKVFELTPTTVAEYTMEGKLLGHISISQTIVKETADQLGIHSDAVTVLRHMILSHHGQYEFGSPVLPATVEAEALHFIDDFDAKMVMIEKELKGVSPKEFSQRVFALENRQFYKHNIQ